MSNRVTLNFKLTCVLFLFLLIGVVNSVIIYSVISQQKGNSRAINLAGRQRMLSQKMTKEAFVLHDTETETDHKERVADLEKTVTLFDTTLN